MKARMTSRVTVMPRLESGEESPEKGWRKGTRAKAVAKWPASSDTSNATIGAGAVATSGRLPIAMAVTLPRLDAKVNPPSPAEPARTCDRTTAASAGRPGPARPSHHSFGRRCRTSIDSLHVPTAPSSAPARLLNPAGAALTGSRGTVRRQHNAVAVLPERGSR